MYFIRLRRPSDGQPKKHAEKKESEKRLQEKHLREALRKRFHACTMLYLEWASLVISGWEEETGEERKMIY